MKDYPTEGEKLQIRPVTLYTIKLRDSRNNGSKNRQLERYINELAAEVRLNRELISEILEFMARLATKQEVIEKSDDIRGLVIRTLSDINNRMKASQRELKGILDEDDFQGVS